MNTEEHDLQKLSSGVIAKLKICHHKHNNICFHDLFRLIERDFIKELGEDPRLRWGMNESETRIDEIIDSAIIPARPMTHDQKEEQKRKFDLPPDDIPVYPKWRGRM